MCHGWASMPMTGTSLAIFKNAKDQSLMGLLRSLPGLLPKGLGVRPIEALYQAFTYTVFGLHPLPYHLCNALVLATTAVLFYASLRELSTPHCITLTVPLIYELLPHYTSDRFWIGAHQAVLSQVLFFLGLYAALRAIRSSTVYSVCLKIASILLFALALLSYEAIVGLLPAAVLLVGYRTYTQRPSDGGKSRMSIVSGVAYCLLAAICLGAILIYKAQFTNRISFPSQHPGVWHIKDVVWNVVRVTVGFNLLHYGVGLPRTAFELYRSSGAGAEVIVIAGVIACAVLLYLHWTFKKTRSALLSGNESLTVIAVGLMLFVLDYLPFPWVEFQLFVRWYGQQGSHCGCGWNGVRSDRRRNVIDTRGRRYQTAIRGVLRHHRRH